MKIIRTLNMTVADTPLALERTYDYPASLTVMIQPMGSDGHIAVGKADDGTPLFPVGGYSCLTLPCERTEDVIIYADPNRGGAATVSVIVLVLE